MIPRKIYYVWIGNKNKPVSVISNIESWRRLNPEYEIIEINEDNFDISSYKFVSQAYDQKMWAFASDVMRIDTIYKNGGIYLDTDVEAIKPFDKLIDSSSFWALENTGAVATGLVFGATKENPILKDILDIYTDLNFNIDNQFETMTVPIVTNVLKKYGLKFNNRKQILKSGAVIYPTPYFAPIHFWGGGKVSKKTITVHHYAASWLSESQNKLNLKNFKRSLTLYIPKIIRIIDILRGKSW